MVEFATRKDRIYICSYLVGLFFTCFGVALILKTNWGLDAWNAVFKGLETRTSISFGMWSIIIQGVFLLITALLTKQMEWLCFLPVVYKGILLDITKVMVFDIPNPKGVGNNALFFIGGYVLVALGTGLYVATKYPKMPIDGLMIALSDTFFKSIRKSRLIIESVGFSTLLLVGGPFGLGTVIVTLTIGYSISISKRMTEKTLLKQGGKNK